MKQIITNRKSYLSTIRKAEDSVEEEVLTRKRIKTSFRTNYFVQSTHFARILHYTVNLLTLRKTAQNIRKKILKNLRAIKTTTKRQTRERNCSHFKISFSNSEVRKQHSCKYNLFQAHSSIFATFRPSPNPSLYERLEQATVTKHIRLYQFTASSIISTQITVNRYSVACVMLTINL